MKVTVIGGPEHGKVMDVNDRQHYNRLSFAHYDGPAVPFYADYDAPGMSPRSGGYRTLDFRIETMAFPNKQTRRIAVHPEWSQHTAESAFFDLLLKAYDGGGR